ncbi:MAG TPA: LppP/LprE family lipoprotein [Solirubrobacteraceae bacterium]|jgi:hypothetical protein
MKRSLRHAIRASAPPLSVGALLGAAVLLGGCGSQTKTVSATAPPAAAQTASTSTTPTATKTSTTQPRTSTSAATPAPTSTRTAPEPAFTQQAGQAEGATGAAAIVRAHGYTPNDTSEYHSGQTLRVLVGTRTGSGDGYGQQAFFFVGARYIGTDAKEPSASVKVLSQGDTEVTLAYPLYRRGDPLSSPSGGQTTVRFQLNNGKLAPLGAIPPASSTGGLSRN